MFKIFLTFDLIKINGLQNQKFPQQELHTIIHFIYGKKFMLGLLFVSV